MRKEFSARTRALAFQRANGFCEKCKVVKLGPGNVEYDHDTPCGLGGDASLENCVVCCKSCHAKKTHGSDNPRMQKADRVRKKHLGIVKPKRSIGGRKFDGTPIPARWR